VGGIGEMGMPITGRYERNWNTLYVGGLPMDWGEMQVRAFSQITSLCYHALDLVATGTRCTLVACRWTRGRCR
jgi:hypothetical protein